ncbi:hypothetical protein DSUL_20202 [Desulfovibrionales bacterium]
MIGSEATIDAISKFISQYHYISCSLSYNDEAPYSEPRACAIFHVVYPLPA